MQKRDNEGRVLARALAKELTRVRGAGDVIATHPQGQNVDITQVSAGDKPSD